MPMTSRWNMSYVSNIHLDSNSSLLFYKRLFPSLRFYALRLGDVVELFEIYMQSFFKSSFSAHSLSLLFPLFPRRS